ncbi:MAG TPA: hypothetical protein VGH20_22705 [Myxococcales bacterium]
MGQPAATQPATACDASLSPQVLVYDTGSCPGVMPKAPSCMAKVAACSGVTASSLGPRGTLAAAATSNASGALAIGCTNADVGPSPGFALFAQSPGGYVSGVHLGDTAVPSLVGFVATQSGVNGRPPSDLVFFDGNGAQKASVSEGTAFVGPAAVEVATVVSGTLMLQQYSFDGKPRGAPQTVGPAAGSVVLDGATDSVGHTLVIWGSYGDASTTARWFAPDGTAESAAFQLDGAASTIGKSQALPGGGIAIGRTAGARWQSVITAGSTIPAPAPAWLAAQDSSFTIVRSGRAMAFGNQIVAPDGTACGTLDFQNAALLGIGQDGTAMATVDGASVLVYPKLLQ